MSYKTYQDQIAAEGMAAIEGSTTIQATVREIFRIYETHEHALDIIAGGVGQLKTTAEAHIGAYCSDASEARNKRKAVNNVINDISRICRNVTDKSIVLAKREGGSYEYRVAEPRPRKGAVPEGEPIKGTLTSPVPAFTATEGALLDRIATLEDELKIAEAQVANWRSAPLHSPDSTLLRMIENFGEETFGELVVNAIRRNRGVVE